MCVTANHHLDSIFHYGFWFAFHPVSTLPEVPRWTATLPHNTITFTKSILIHESSGSTWMTQHSTECSVYWNLLLLIDRIRWGWLRLLSRDNHRTIYECSIGTWAHNQITLPISLTHSFSFGFLLLRNFPDDVHYDYYSTWPAVDERNTKEGTSGLMNYLVAYEH